MRVWLPYVEGGSGADVFTRGLAHELASMGHQAVAQSFSHRLQYAPDLLRSVRGPRADVVLAPTWSGFAFSRSRIPLVAMEQLCVLDPAYAAVRSPGQELFHHVFVRRYESRTLAAADAIVAVSEDVRDALRRVFGVEASVIHNGVDVHFFTPVPATPRRPGQPFELLFVGNMTRRKGADLLQPLMRELGPGFRLSYTTGMRDRTSHGNVDGLNLGSLTPNQVRAAYRRAHALVFPTRLEGLPLTVIEAMACGLPVVGSNRSSMPELVEDGVTGVLADLDPVALAAAVVYLAEDEDRRIEMGRAGRERAVARFSLSHTARRYVDVFESLL